MANFIGLIRNENMKIYRRIGSIIMLLLLVGGIILMGVIEKTTTEKANDANWKQAVTKEIKEDKKTLNEKLPDDIKKHVKRNIAINEYRLEHNIKPIQSDSLWGFVDNTSDLVSVISIFTIIIAGGILASEFSWGTIKLLLIRPVSRTMVLFSKYIATLLYAVFMLVVLFAVSWILGGILFGFEGVSAPYLAYTDGKVVEQNMVLHIMSTYGLNCISLIMMVTFAFMMSTVFRNSSLAIGISIFLTMGSSIAIQILHKYDWVKYVLFANTDLTQYTTGTPLVEGMTLGFSLTVLAVYFIIFVALSLVVFNKRDVAA
ncbi:ABC transporter permease [Fictibacillus gelatini]|uniref:ABC transporter permease n=1 Tax=Fictibacillus gelatini TaxID=225985 RepID=UPI000403092C|nr:ABC transporter permease subunit [Fictibacillus gelatini]